MKTLTIVLAHPIAQLLSFIIVMIGGQIFVAPFGWMIRYALPTGEPFAIAGVIAIAITLGSLLIKTRWLQILGLAVMWSSLVIFFSQLSENGRANISHYPIEYITLGMFILISLLVIRKQFLWKNF